jgi:para-nitrobenzyl esterase
MNLARYIHNALGTALAALILLSGAAALAAEPSAADPSAADPSLVVTTSGPVQGLAHDGVREFRGIPYAAAPVANLRFELPAPVQPWTSVRKATAYGSPCPQVVRYGLTEASDDEDCLFLNVAVPKVAGPKAAEQGRKPLPVLVWLHGGAFVGGSGTLYPLDYLARRGQMVVVSVNYRLGALGFMTHPAFGAAHNGAYALEDQRQALRWVQHNIAAFGGDPANVTLAGESAGAASVCMHLFAPKQSAGLFHKAIIQSAGCTVPLRTVTESQSTGLKLAALVGCDKLAEALSCLRSKSAKTLAEAGYQVAGTELMAFAPTVGLDSQPKQGREALSSGDFLHMPIINGGNRDEMRLYVAYQVAAGGVVTAANYADQLGAVYGPHADAVQARYPLSQYGSAAVALGTAMSDYMPGVGLNYCMFLKTADLAKAWAPVYQYEFADRAAPLVTGYAGFEMGAVHSAKLPYFFPNFSNKSKLDGPNLAAPSQALAEQMVAYWSAFVHTSKPSAPGAPDWAPYQSDASVLRLVPGATGTFNAGAEHNCSFWRGLYPDAL